MAVWTFFDFLDMNDKSVIAKWMESLPVGAQAKIDARLLQMRGIEIWLPKWTKFLVGHDKIIELRIPYNKVQYRPLGCYGPGQKEFTLLVGAIEKGWKIPKPVMKLADIHRKLIYEDRRYIREHQYN